jgi:hypothetical protein
VPTLGKSKWNGQIDGGSPDVGTDSLLRPAKVEKSRIRAPRKPDGPLEIRSQGDEILALRTDLAASLPTVGLGEFGQPRPLQNRLQRVAERFRRRVHFLP